MLFNKNTHDPPNHPTPNPINMSEIILRGQPEEKQATANTLRLWRAHLVDGGLLDEAGSVGGQQPVRGHDVNLIGSSFFQNLRCRHKVSDIIYDVILGTKMYILNVSANTGPKHLHRWLP